MSRPKIAIPVPHSYKPEYAQRSLPQYVHAVEAAGGEAVVIRLDQPSEAIAKQATECQGVLLPGSSADVDPQKYGAERDPLCNPGDKLRDAVDELLLQDAHNMHKPILAICYGMQSLNVWRTGSLVQDIPSHSPPRSIIPLDVKLRRHTPLPSIRCQTWPAYWPKAVVRRLR